MKANRFLASWRGMLAVGCVLLALVGCHGKGTSSPAAAPTSASTTSPLRLKSTVIGKGPPFVLLGGGLMGIAGFEKHAETIAADHKVVRLQHLAVQYGLEGRELPPGYSIKMESAAMAAALDALGITGPIDLMGHSSGALIALDFATNHPDRIRSLVLSEPPAYFLLDAEERASPELVAWVQMLNRIPRQGEITEDQVDAFLHGVGAVPPDKNARELPMWPAWVKHRASLKGGPAVVDYDGDPARVSAFKRPTLLVRGENTAPAHVHFNAQLEKRMPHAKRLDLRGGHGGVLVSRDRFLDELRKFLGSAS